MKEMKEMKETLEMYFEEEIYYNTPFKVYYDEFLTASIDAVNSVCPEGYDWYRSPFGDYIQFYLEQG